MSQPDAENRIYSLRVQAEELRGLLDENEHLAKRSRWTTISRDHYGDLLKSKIEQIEDTLEIIGALNESGEKLT